MMLLPSSVPLRLPLPGAPAAEADDIAESLGTLEHCSGFMLVQFSASLIETVDATVPEASNVSLLHAMSIDWLAMSVAARSCLKCALYQQKLPLVKVCF